MARQYRPENPELPTLDPWRNTTQPPAEQFVFERNPFFHRVDENGLQLPYIDRFVLNVSSSSIISAKAGAGESDLQGIGHRFRRLRFPEGRREALPGEGRLWKRTQGSRLALLPNLNCGRPHWRRLLRDARVRRALSLAIDRREINKAVFYGLAQESADTVLPESPLYRPEFARPGSPTIPHRPMRCLTKPAFSMRDDDGIRLLPDGRPAQIIVETAGESTIETDVLELVTDHWRKIGISLFIRTSQRDVFRSRALGGQIMMSMWSGIDNGVPTADMNPGQLAPTADDQLQWPLWGAHYISHGKVGEAPDLPAAAELLRFSSAGAGRPNPTERTEVWTAMLALYTDQVFSIGIVNGTFQPVLSTSRLRNMPDTALYGFDPTCYFGVYMPDTFWLGETPERAAIHRLAHRRHDPDAADHIGAGVHDHRAAAGRLFRQLCGGAQSAGRRCRPGSAGGCAQNMVSTNRRSCATSTGSPACCRAISATPSNISCRSATSSGTGCG